MSVEARARTQRRNEVDRTLAQQREGGSDPLHRWRNPSIGTDWTTLAILEINDSICDSYFTSVDYQARKLNTDFVPQEVHNQGELACST